MTDGSEQEYTLEVVPILENGKTFIPLELINKASDLLVEWEPTTRTAYITTPSNVDLMATQQPPAQVGVNETPATPPVVTGEQTVTGADGRVITIPDQSIFENEDDPVFSGGFGLGEFHMILSASWESGYKRALGLLGAFGTQANPLYLDYEVRWDLGMTHPAANYTTYDGEGASTNILASWTDWTPAIGGASGNMEANMFRINYGLGVAEGLPFPHTSDRKQIFIFEPGTPVKALFTIRCNTTGEEATWLVQFDYPTLDDKSHKFSVEKPEVLSSDFTYLEMGTNIVRIK
jgi:hypothetical protein